MAIRSLSEIWVDANFKETQLRDLRIGQPADLYVDMYGDKQVFKGRITGFTIGTGSTLAWLPPQNATGNSSRSSSGCRSGSSLRVTIRTRSRCSSAHRSFQYVYINKPPTGPDAGKFLQSTMQPSSGTASATSAPGVGK